MRILYFKSVIPTITKILLQFCSVRFYQPELYRKFVQWTSCRQTKYIIVIITRLSDVRNLDLAVVPDIYFVVMEELQAKCTGGNVLEILERNAGEYVTLAKFLQQKKR